MHGDLHLGNVMVGDEGLKAIHLAALTGRLCQQAASWDDRTQTPAPLHLAELADLDHPQRAEGADDADDS